MYIGTLSLYRGEPLVTRDCFSRQIPVFSQLPRFSFSFLVNVVPPPAPVAKTSFESPVSALHAEAFVAARILLNVRRSRSQAIQEKIEEDLN